MWGRVEEGHICFRSAGTPEGLISFFQEIQNSLLCNECVNKVMLHVLLVLTMSQVIRGYLKNKKYMTAILEG